MVVRFLPTFYNLIIGLYKNPRNSGISAGLAYGDFEGKGWLWKRKDQNKKYLTDKVGTGGDLKKVDF